MLSGHFDLSNLRAFKVVLLPNISFLIMDSISSAILLSFPDNLSFTLVIILLIPIIVDIDEDQILIYDENIFYKKWNINKKRFFLLDYFLPSEDLEDVNLLYKNSKSIEEYDFKEIVQRYDLKDFIITIIYKDNNKIKILSKIQLNNFFKIDNKSFENINLSNSKDFDYILDDLKNSYENYWKNLNQINTSIKLPITISIESKRYNKITSLEDSLSKIDLVSSYNIIKFDNQKILFKIIYNGSPDKFITDMKNVNILIDTQNQIWNVK